MLYIDDKINGIQMYCQYWTTNNAGIYLEKNIF